MAIPGKKRAGKGKGAELQQAVDPRLSVRLPPELLGELYGAADQLGGQGVTVTSLVTEAVERFLAELRRKRNGGRPFPRSGPKARPKATRKLLA